MYAMKERIVREMLYINWCDVNAFILIRDLAILFNKAPHPEA